METGLQLVGGQPLSASNVQQAGAELEAVQQQQQTERPSTVFVPLSASGDVIRALCQVFASRQLRQGGSARAAGYFSAALLRDGCLGCRTEDLTATVFHSCKSSIPAFLAEHFSALCALFCLQADDASYSTIADVCALHTFDEDPFLAFCG